MRRISGRHQISADGKHLVDGLAFGRPLLRRPADRPAVNIPPRKRRRVTYTEDEDDDPSFLALKGNDEAEGEDSDDGNGNRQLVLHADFEDDDSENDEDFIPGEDEELDEDADDTEADEDKTMGNEAEEQDGQMESFNKSSAREEEDYQDESALDDVSDEATRTKIRKLHSAFPNSPLAVCKYVLNGSRGDVGEAYSTMSLGFQPVKPTSAITETSKASLSVPKTRSKKRRASVEGLEAPDNMQVKAAETADSLLLEHYDQNGLPPGSISLGKALSHMAEVIQGSPGRSRPTPRRSDSAFSPKSVRFSLDEGLTNGVTSTLAIGESQAEDSEEETEDSSSDVTSSSGSSSSDEESSSSDESKEDAEVSDTSSSGSDSDSSSDSSSDDDAPEETSRKATNASLPKTATASAEILSPKSISRTLVPPGNGKPSTNARNIRRKGANVLNRFKEKGILPAGTTLAEFKQLSGVNSETSPEDAFVALEAIRAVQNSTQLNGRTDGAVKKSKEFEARRQALFASLESGGIEVGLEYSKNAPKSLFVQNESVSDTTFATMPSLEDPQDVLNSLGSHKPSFRDDASQIEVAEETVKQASQVTPKVISPQASSTPLKPASSFAGAVSKESTSNTSIATKSKPPTPAAESAQSSATSSRRTKLDVGAGRRMLFGALGLKAPKSKQDEEKVRSELMKDIRPIPIPKTTEKDAQDAKEEAEDEDSEVWREKITYRAVECCHDGIELSEPPFPFVQRWDPQQQGGWSQKSKNGGKRKKNQRDESQYCQDEGRLSKKQRQRKGKHNYAEHQEYLDASYKPSYQEDSIVESEELTQQTRFLTDNIEGEINQKLTNNLNEVASAQVSQESEDLATLPEDPKTLVDLQDGQAKPGMTIAFKQLTMSEETKWQPEISAYRTAVVNDILGSGELQLTLALRDRLNSEKFYDGETGERIYGKFDMPDQDEEEDEPADDGIRNLTFSELVEPKIVQDATSNLGVDYTETVEATSPKLGTSSDPQISSHEHEDELADAQFSHVTETPLNSDASESNLQDTNQDSVPKSPKPDTKLENQELNRASPGPNSQLSDPEAGTSEDDALKQVAENLVEETVVPADQEDNGQTVEKDKSKEVFEDKTAEHPITVGGGGDATPRPDPDTSIGQITTDARLKISQKMKDAGFRSSVPSSVMKDIRRTGMESPGGTKVFEKLMKDMTEIESNPPYSPRFHGLDSSSPIKKSRQVSTGREPSSSPVRVQSGCQIVDTDAASSPPMMNDEGESSWLTTDSEEPSNLPARVPSKRAVKKTKPAKKFKVPNLSKAQELWEALQPTSRKTSFGSQSSKASPRPSLGLDGTNEKDSTISVKYPKLSVGSSFTSQISDHGRQPDVNFDDSALTNGDTPKPAVFEDDTFMRQRDGPISDIEQGLPFHKSAISSNNEQQQDDPFSDESPQPDDPFPNNEPQPPRKARINESAKSRSKTPEVLLGSPLDDAFPTLGEVSSQRDTTREKSTPARSKPARQSKAEKIQKKARDEHLGPLDDEETTPRAPQKNSRPSNLQRSLHSASQVRRSSRQSKVRGSQPQTSQNSPSQNQSKFVIPQGSQVMDLTLASSDVEEEAENGAVVSEVEQQPKKFRKHALNEDDDQDCFEDEPGWVQKSSSQKGVKTRRKSSTGLRASSKSSPNTSRRKTTARF